MSEYQMQPEPEPTPRTPPRRQDDGGRRPGVEGMSASLSFGTTGTVAINVLITQDSTFDDSSDFSLVGAVGSAAGSTLQMSSIGGVGPYDSGEDFSVSVIFQGTNGTTLSGTVGGTGVSINNTEDVGLSGGGQTMEGEASFRSNGTADVTLDLSSDSSITRTSDNFTVQAGPSGSERKVNVTGITGSGRYTAGESYTVSVQYTDGQGQIQLYSGEVPASEVSSGANRAVPMSLQ